MVINALLSNYSSSEKYLHPDTKLPISNIMKRMPEMGDFLCVSTGCRNSVIQRL